MISCEIWHYCQGSLSSSSFPPEKKYNVLRSACVYVCGLVCVNWIKGLLAFPVVNPYKTEFYPLPCTFSFVLSIFCWWCSTGTYSVGCGKGKSYYMSTHFYYGQAPASIFHHSQVIHGQVIVFNNNHNNNVPYFPTSKKKWVCGCVPVTSFIGSGVLFPWATAWCSLSLLCNNKE